MKAYFLKKVTVGQLIRALRLPFVSASILPFVLGSLIEKGRFNFLLFALGCIAAVSTHLSANLINDYADSKSGADWQDKRFYGFFGGSKLIQEHIVTERFYLHAALFFASLAGFAVVGLSLALQSIAVLGFFAFILALAWAYSAYPLKLSYRRCGEAVIFFLFGPALVMGGYFIQTGIFPDWKAFCISLPVGFLVTAILFANEVPDYPEDKQAGKLNWISFTGQKNAYLVYGALIILAFLTLGLNAVFQYQSFCALAALIFIAPAVRAAKIIATSFNDKTKLMQSSQLTIAVHAMVSFVLILDTLICKK